MQVGFVESLAASLQWGAPTVTGGGAITEWPGLEAACSILVRLLERPLGKVRIQGYGV